MAKANSYPTRTLVNIYGEDGSGAFGKSPQITLPLSVVNGGGGGATAQASSKNLSTVYALAQSAVQNSFTGGTGETTLATVTIPANLLGANGRVRVTAVYSYTNSGNNKTPRVRTTDGTNTMILYQVVQTTSAVLKLQVEFANRNSSSSQMSQPNGLGGTGTTSGSIVTGAMDTTLPVTLTLTGQLASAGETISLEFYLVEVIQSAGN